MLQKLINTCKDYSIIFSFDRSGYERHAHSFEKIDDHYFDSKHYLITGGTSGIGEALAKRLVNAGAKVTVTGRNKSTFNASSLGQRGVEFFPFDLADFERLKSIELPKIDGLICNAGGMPDTLTVVDAKYDEIFASQVVGHYILINRAIKEHILTPNAPIHITSSGGMYVNKLTLNDLAWRDREYDKVSSYANAKRAQVILNRELAKIYPQHHFSCSHPGWVGTDALAKALPKFADNMAGRLRNAEQGADTIYWCLSQYEALKSGQFWFDRKARVVYPFFWTRESAQQRDTLLNMCQSALNT